MRMGGSAGLLRALLRALITGLVALAAGAQLASAQTPTPEQLETFQNLPPDQQRAVLEAMQDGDTANESVERPARADRRHTPRAFPDSGRPDGRSALGGRSSKNRPARSPGATRRHVTVTANPNLPIVERALRSRLGATASCAATRIEIDERRAPASATSHAH